MYDWSQTRLSLPDLTLAVHTTADGVVLSFQLAFLGLALNTRSLTHVHAAWRFCQTIHAETGRRILRVLPPDSLPGTDAEDGAMEALEGSSALWPCSSDSCSPRAGMPFRAK
jgi:hypothetical protein